MIVLWLLGDRELTYEASGHDHHMPMTTKGYYSDSMHAKSSRLFIQEFIVKTITINQYVTMFGQFLSVIH